ncbi:MAG: helix-turn-helix domain-containing protein [Methylacidiphilales bacterium]|nr:helix-turn-helix domain-containing protein [Candidatus Methylacidiphilales bacterium]
MQTTQELGDLVARRRHELKLKQKDVANRAGLTPGLLSRLERGHLPEFGVRKLMALLAVLGLELQATESGTAGNLDELRKEHGGI